MLTIRWEEKDISPLQPGHHCNRQTSTSIRSVSVPTTVMPAVGVLIFAPSRWRSRVDARVSARMPGLIRGWSMRNRPRPVTVPRD